MTGVQTCALPIYPDEINYEEFTYNANVKRGQQYIGKILTLLFFVLLLTYLMYRYDVLVWIEDFRFRKIIKEAKKSKSMKKRFVKKISKIGFISRIKSLWPRKKESKVLSERARSIREEIKSETDDRETKLKRELKKLQRKTASVSKDLTDLTDEEQILLENEKEAKKLAKRLRKVQSKEVKQKKNIKRSIKNLKNYKKTLKKPIK